jgi:hypothetical protein
MAKKPKTYETSLGFFDLAMRFCMSQKTAVSWQALRKRRGKWHMVDSKKGLKWHFAS